MSTTKSELKWPPELAISYNLNMSGKEYMEVPYNKQLTMVEYKARLFGGVER